MLKILYLLAGVLLTVSTGWGQTKAVKLVASDAATEHGFGISVSISNNRILVGAAYNNDAGPRSGSAYVYERDRSGAWAEVAKLTGTDVVGGDRFGLSVSISGDYIVVGVPDAGLSSGSAWNEEFTPQAERGN